MYKKKGEAYAESNKWWVGAKAFEFSLEYDHKGIWGCSCWNVVAFG